MFLPSLLMTAALAGSNALMGNVAPEMATANAWYECAFLGKTPVQERKLPSLEVKRQDYTPLKFNTSIWGTTPIVIGDRTFKHGLGSHAFSDIAISLPSPGKTFHAFIGVDNNYDTAGVHGSVDFSVKVGDKEIYHSPVLTCGQAPVELNLPLNGATEFSLHIANGGDGDSYDQSDWADAKTILENGKELWLDEMHRVAPPAGFKPGLPFSFTYGGKASAELLPTWEAARGAGVSPARGDEGGRDTRPAREVLTFRDPATGLLVTCETKRYSDFPAVEWLLTFENTGDKPAPVLENVCTWDATAMPASDAKMLLHHSRGSGCAPDDFAPVTSKPAEVDVTLRPDNGRSSDGGALPFFNLDWGSGGAVVAVGWSGQWQAFFKRSGAGVHATAGMQFMKLSLLPGEKIRSPRMLMCFWEGADRFRGHNLFRQLILAHYTPRVDGKIVTPPISMVPAGNELNNSTEENQIGYMDAMKQAGCECFWLDAGWFEGGWPSGAGSWNPRKDHFPNGLAPVGKAAHDRGLGFVLWFEPERVSPGTRIATEHPEFVLHAAGQGEGLFNLGDPKARQWLTDELSRRIGDWGITVYRNDFNIAPLPFWQAADVSPLAGRPAGAEGEGGRGGEADVPRVGITEIRYNEGLYQMWDDLRARHPGLAIDNCSSGGRRIDLETVSRSYPLWRSDLQCGPDPPAASQAHTAGLSLYVPLHSTGLHSWDTYKERSTTTMGVAYFDMRMANGIKVAEARPRIEEIKRLRPFWLGDYYPLIPVNTNEETWCAMQFDRPDLHSGIVYLFRRSESPYPSAELKLHGLDPKATYTVGYIGEKGTQEMKGEKLARLTATVSDAPGSRILTYKRKP
jgi:alpha-galactosidase